MMDTTHVLVDNQLYYMPAPNTSAPFTTLFDTRTSSSDRGAGVDDWTSSPRLLTPGYTDTAGGGNVYTVHIPQAGTLVP